MYSENSVDSLIQGIAEIRKVSKEAQAAVHKLQAAIAKVISGPAKKPLREIISKCKISIYAEEQELIVDAPNLEVALSILKLRSRSRELAQIAHALAIEKIIVRTKEAEDFFLVRDKVLKKGSSMVPTNFSLEKPLTSADVNNAAVAQMCLLSTHSSTIVTIENSICLLTNEEPHRAFTGFSPLDYLGKSVANLWIPSETERLFRYLEKDKFVEQFEYIGYRKRDIDEGLRIKTLFCADFRLVYYMGHLCRLGTFRFA